MYVNLKCDNIIVKMCSVCVERSVTLHVNVKSHMCDCSLEQCST